MRNEQKYKVHKEKADKHLASAKRSLLLCDTIEAKQHFINAAQELYEAAGYAENRNILLLAAGEAYIDAGEWASATYILREIRLDALDEEAKELYRLWSKQASARVNNEEDDHFGLLEQATANEEWDKVIEILRNDPYILPPVELAKFRSQACSALGKEDAAEMFAKDAERLAAKYDAKPVWT